MVEKKVCRIDRLQDIEVLEQTVEMVFGGINPNQYAERYNYNKGEQVGHCDRCEVIAPKKFRDEVQSAVMEGYRKYWG